MTPKDIARFWSGVERSDECWLWIRSRKARGYGRFMMGGRQYIASRVAWEITFGPIPPGKDVLHRCDTPACVRPSHLFLGGDRENAQDRANKDRSFHPHGSLDGNAKLDEAMVILIRDDYANGVANIPQLATFYGVSSGLIGQIIAGHIWKHVGGSVRKGYAGGERSNKNVVTEAQVREIRTRREAGEKLAVLASAYGCSMATISLIARGRIWRSVT